MRVTISPDKHAYFAGETLHVRIEFNEYDRQPKKSNEEQADGEAGGDGKMVRRRLGIIGAGSLSAEKKHQPSSPGHSTRHSASDNCENGKEKIEGVTTSTPGTGHSTPQTVAPVPVPAVSIPQHHPHARKVSIAQVPTPPSSLLGSPQPVDGQSENAMVEGKAEAQGVVVTPSTRFRSPLATISESHNSSTASPPRISTTATPTITHPIITFATIQMTGQMTPSTAYIPPEPLIPLRNLLLLQPIGSNGSSLAPPPHTPTSSSFSSSGEATTSHFVPSLLHFSSPTSAIDNAAADGTLTSSLTSLARGLFSPVTAGGAAEGEGTWEDHRKQVWLSRDLPVWISPKDVVCVDTQVDGISGSISWSRGTDTYAIPIPAHLPPTFKGKAISFAYTLRLSLSVTFPATNANMTTTGATRSGSGGKTPDEGKPSSMTMSSPLSALSSSSTAAWKLFSPVRAFTGAHNSNLDQTAPPPPVRVVQKELVVPVRVLPRITVPPTGESYDLLLPVIPRVSSGKIQQVVDQRCDVPRKGVRRANGEDKKSGEKAEDVAGLMRFVKETLDELRGGEIQIQTSTPAHPPAQSQRQEGKYSATFLTTSEMEVGDQASTRAPALAGNNNHALKITETKVDSARRGTGLTAPADTGIGEITPNGTRVPGEDETSYHEDNGELAPLSGGGKIDGAPSANVSSPPTASSLAPRPPSFARSAMMAERLSGREAVQALVRSSRPGRFEIVKKHQQIAVLSLPRVAWRTGEAMRGVVEFHDSVSRFDVLKLSIDLVTTETIPSPLLPHAANHSDPTQPLLQRTLAQYGNAYTLDLARTGFELGIPADATPSFQICAGNASEETGGLSWGLHLRFLVRERASERRKHGHEKKRADARVDEVGYRRSGMTGELIQQDKPPDLELDVDIVECTIPLNVYPNDRGKPHVRDFRL